MSKKPPPEGYDDNPEWTDADFAKAQPASSVHATEAAAALVKRGRGRPPGSDKERVTLRIDSEYVERYRDKGAGWQTRMNNAFAYMQPQMDNLIRLRDEQLSYIAGLKDGITITDAEGRDVTPGLIRRAEQIAARLQQAIDDGRENYGLADDTRQGGRALTNAELRGTISDGVRPSPAGEALLARMTKIARDRSTGQLDEPANSEAKGSRKRKA